VLGNDSDRDFNLLDEEPAPLEFVMREVSVREEKAKLKW